jgi:hypothetical protein
MTEPINFRDTLAYNWRWSCHFTQLAHLTG